jgi:hypothetical protein
MSTAKTGKTMERSEPEYDETILRIAKEITVKFIEVGRVNPANFRGVFEDVYSTIKTTVEQEGQ